jgi:hypothetical protein
LPPTTAERPPHRPENEACCVWKNVAVKQPSMLSFLFKTTRFISAVKKTLYGSNLFCVLALIIVFINNKILSVIPRFHREVNENCPLLDYYAANSGNSLRNYPEEWSPHNCLIVVYDRLTIIRWDISLIRYIFVFSNSKAASSKL